MSYTTRLTFLGTGTSQGVPMIGCGCPVCTSADTRDNRLRSSALIEHNGLSILIDAGPDFRQQLLRENICDLDAILLTHEHKDHTGGLDDVRAINYFANKALPIYCEGRVFRSLEREYAYAFSEYRYPGAPEFDIRQIDTEPFVIYHENGFHRSGKVRQYAKIQEPREVPENASVLVTPIRVMHYKLPVLGYRIGDIAYITDGSKIDDTEFVKLKNLEVLVINTVRKERHISHFSLQEAIDVAQRVGARKSYLTHLSHQIGTHSQLLKELPAEIEPAYDGLVVTV
ncbi:MAG: MBL fold metallo-hydrolase [Bacteroidales bacterium]